MNDDECRKEFEEEPNDCLEGLLAFFAAIPKETTKLLNVPKYREMLDAASHLKDLLSQFGESGMIEINVHPEFNLGAVTAEVTSLTVENPELLLKVLKSADNFEVYPLVNGNIKIEIAFQSVMNTLG